MSLRYLTLLSTHATGAWQSSGAAEQPCKNEMDTPPKGDSGAPAWLKKGLTLLHRILCALLILGVFVLVLAHVFEISINISPMRLFQLGSLTIGFFSVTDTWRTWLLRLPVSSRFSPPVPYGYPGRRSILQSHLAAGVVLIVFGASLSLL